jgi:hypothetical protein
MNQISRQLLTRKEYVMSTLTTIENEIASLPLNLRTEVLDFVRFVKQRHGLPRASVVEAAVPGAGDSPFFQALTEAGFVGCIETDEQLATTYKGRLDFSAKIGTRP